MIKIESRVFDPTKQTTPGVWPSKKREELDAEIEGWLNALQGQLITIMDISNDYHVILRAVLEVK